MTGDLKARCLALAGLAPVSADSSEREFQAELIAEALRRGWACYHTFDSRRSVAGFPDLVMLRAGSLIAAELKVKKNKTTAAQEAWLSLFGMVPGVRVFRWRPEDWADIVKELT